jgi:DNA-binding MurR/RpiR family transcriptional regulator
VSPSNAPTADANVIQSLRDSYDELTKSQKRIAEAIVEDPEFVAFATVDKMAARLGVSPSTVVRFTYRLGLTGYHDLQERVRTLVRSQMRSSTADVDEAGVLEHLGETAFARSLEHDLANLRQTIAGLEGPELQRAVDLLSQARRIVVAADGTAHSVASYMTLALDRTRGEVTLALADTMSVGRLIDIGPEDVMLAITFPPYAQSVHRAVRWAKERQTKVLAITDSPVSPVGQLGDVDLAVRVSGVGPHNTMVAVMAVANALLNQLVLQSQDRALARYGVVNSLMEDWDLSVLKSGGES